MNQNEFYLGNQNVKRDGVKSQFTEQQVSEYVKCLNDPAYFARTYVKIIHLDHGLVNFNLYPYQEKMFKHFNDNRFSIVLACRQSGKSISSVAYLLWYACFHPEQTIAILANKGATAREMLARVTLMLENLPFFLQPGCKALNKGSIEFSNNSRIIASATSGSSIRGMSINLLMLDEFAFVENDAEFYTSTYPVISSGKNTKIIITSTANGVGNVFHKLWEGAVQKTNEFGAFTVNWWDVPGRDEEWKKQTIANTSELQFDQEFGNSFHGRGNTLIASNVLLEQKAKDPIHYQENVYLYNKPIEGHGYVMCVDVAQGRGQDYSTFTIIDITTEPFEQVAVFRDNELSPLLFPDIIYKYATIYNKAFILVESNDQGSVVANALWYDLEYENMFLESMIKSDGIGIRMNRRIKRIGCSGFKDLCEQRKLQIHDANTIIEMSTFVSRGNSYQASNGNHDDLVMNLVLFGWFVTSDIFAEMTQVDLKDLLYRERLKEIQNDLPPFGIIDDGRNNRDYHVDEDGTVWLSSTVYGDSNIYK